MFDMTHEAPMTPTTGAVSSASPARSEADVARRRAAATLSGLTRLVERQAEAERRVVLDLVDVHGAGLALDAEGLDTEAWLRLHTSMTGTQARMAVTLAERLPGLPRLREELAAGAITVPAAGRIASLALELPADARAEFLNAVLDPTRRDGECAEDLLRRADLEQLYRLADPDLERRERADRGARWLAVQPDLDGGMGMHGWFDAETAAPVLRAIDAAVSLPSTDDPEPATPAQARADALATVCETFLGGSNGRAARPRLTVTVDVEALAARRGPGRLDPDGPLPRDGGPAAVSGTTIDRLACDALVTRIVTAPDGTPLDATFVGETIPSPLRAAVALRDVHCRFPTCRAPAAWSDVHHVVHRADGGPTRYDNLVTLCRRHHTAVHDRRWSLRLRPDGALEVRRGRKRWNTHPPPRPG